MMEFDDMVKTFGSKAINMIEAKPLNMDYLLGREWELPQINKSVIKYPTSSSLYENQDGSASITFGNYKTVNVEVESDSEIETVNVIQEEILLNIEIVEIMCKNYTDEQIIEQIYKTNNSFPIICSSISFNNSLLFTHSQGNGKGFAISVQNESFKFN